jgi:hypothetical protein
MSTGFPTAANNQALRAHSTCRHSPHWSTPESPAQEPELHHYPPRTPNQTTDVRRGGRPQHHRSAPPHRRTAGPPDRATPSRRRVLQRRLCEATDHVEAVHDDWWVLKVVAGRRNWLLPAQPLSSAAPRRAATAPRRRPTNRLATAAHRTGLATAHPPDRGRYGAADVTEGEKSVGCWRTQAVASDWASERWIQCTRSSFR